MQRRLDLARALAPPLVLAIAATLMLAFLNDYMFRAAVDTLKPATQWWLQLYAWLEQAVMMLLLAVLAIRCHRLVLCPVTTARPESTLALGRRELRYGFWSLVILLAGMLLVTLTMLPLTWLLASVTERQGLALPGWIGALSALPGLYVFARLCPVLPAIALDRPMTLATAWQLTRRNQWSIFLVAAVIPHLLYVGFASLANRFELADFRLVIAAGSWLIAIWGLVTLSVVYRRIVPDAGRANL